MPWGAMVCAVIAAHGESNGSDAFAAYTRASRLARKRRLAAIKPWLIAAGIVAGLWLGYHALMWTLWWNPHPTVLINTVYP